MAEAVDTEAFLERYRERLQDVQQRAALAQEQLAANVVTVSSPDQAVTVSVSPTGSLQGLRMSQRADTMTGAQLSTAIMAAYRRATRQAAARTVEIVTEFAGENSPALAQLKASLPDAVEDEEPSR